MLLGWFEGVSSLSGGVLGLFTIVCGFLCGVGFCGGYCWFSLLGFPSGGYGCWTRVEVGWWLLCGGFGAVLGVVAYSFSAGWFVAGGVGCGRDDCWGFLWVSVRGLLSPFCGGFVCVSLWVWAVVAHGG